MTIGIRAQEVFLAGHFLSAVKVQRHVPLRQVTVELSTFDILNGSRACAHHRNTPCPQGEQCLGRCATQWGALVYVRSRPLGGSIPRFTGFAKLTSDVTPAGFPAVAGVTGWLQVTPDLKPHQWGQQFDWPLNWSDAGTLHGPVAAWLDKVLAAAGGAGTQGGSTG